MHAKAGVVAVAMHSRCSPASSARAHDAGASPALVAQVAEPGGFDAVRRGDVAG
ncbi:hypothetical protein H0E84_06280 [Luteimonas sp. SJ-92]|uniref:Uncharacterized protein n=1 Tax=Luteimonas salinisoli TaxID=2752307 RepID=A0A853JBF2_9GAMM|nr:hypothetical protein [Luteimonas salinisoli]NZA25987.1 hypothetical protein [Luteimonas salinisoli]